MTNAKFECPVDEEMMFAAGTFQKMAREHGKSKKELREAVRKATTIFIHYVVDYAAQQHQGADDQRAVVIKPLDISRAVEDLGFAGVARKLRQKK